MHGENMKLKVPHITYKLDLGALVKEL